MKATIMGIPLRQHFVHVLVLLVALLFISEPSIVPATWHKFMKAVGEAGIIALLVIYLVEIQSHKRLEEASIAMISRIGRNIFGLVYGHDLPEKIVTAVEANTLKQPIYRESIRLQYELKAMTHPDEISFEGAFQTCQVKINHGFTLKNCSNEAVEVPIRIYLERDKWLTDGNFNTAVPTEPKIFEVKIGSTTYCDPINDHVDSNDSGIEKTQTSSLANKSPIAEIKKLSAYINTEDEGNKLTFLDRVKIPAEGNIQVTYSGVLHKRYTDNEFWTTAYPTAAVELTIATTDYDVNVDFPFAQEPQSTGDIAKTWSSDDVMLKGHCIIFWWTPKKTS